MHDRSVPRETTFFCTFAGNEFFGMKALNDHLSAFRLAFQHLTQGKYWGYFLPSLVVGLLFGGFFGLLNWFAGFSSATGSVPVVGEYLADGISSFVRVTDVITTEIYKFFILTLLSPISCLLSEKVDNEVTGGNFSGGLTRIITDLLRAVFIVLVALLLNLVFMSAWWLFAKWTGFHLLDEIVYFAIAAFFMGFSFYDYSLERYGIGTFASWQFGFRKWPHILLTGLTFSILFSIPVVGIIGAPFVMTIVSTMVYINLSKTK